MGKKVYIYVTEGDDGVTVDLFKTRDLVKERFIRDIIDDNDWVQEGDDQYEQVEELKKLQRENGTLEERYSLAETIYDYRDDYPYYQHNNSPQHIIKRLPLAS